MKLDMTRITQAQEKMAAKNQLLKQDIQELMSRIKEQRIALSGQAEAGEGDENNQEGNKSTGEGDENA